MNNFIKATGLKIAVATALLGGVLLPVKPAAADDLLQDIGIGAAANLVTGGILQNGSAVGNTVKGAATGAAVNATQNEDNNSVSGTVQDAAVGAAANATTGAILDDGSFGENALTGAATGVLLNVLD